MNVFFLFPYPLGESPSQRFRFEQYFDHIQRTGIQYQCQSFWDERTWRILYKKGHTLTKVMGFLKGVLRRFGILFKLRQANYIFIHRETLPVGPPIIEWAIAKVLRKKIIYDFDDAIWLPNTSKENSIAAWIKWHSKTASICRWSYKVSCGNDYLADFARQYNSRVVVNPTTIDTEYHHNPALCIKPVSDSITVGWTGSHSTLKYLDEVVPILQRLEEKYGDTFRFVVIANRAPSLALHRLEFIPWVEETEIKDLMNLDIGIMPLTDDMWAKGKCGFKALQYMALQIPAVTSPVGVNTRIIESGVTGFLCTTADEWFQAIDTLMQNAQLRRHMGEQGRKKIERDYSVISNSSTVLSLFE